MSTEIAIYSGVSYLAGCAVHLSYHFVSLMWAYQWHLTVDRSKEIKRHYKCIAENHVSQMKRFLIWPWVWCKGIYGMVSWYRK